MPFMNRARLKPFAFWCLALTCNVLFPDSPATADPGTCQASAPDGWQGVSVRWEGACTGGQAEGSGVLRGLDKGRVVHWFYGRMKAGQPELGVDELAGGYVAGRFVDGKAVPGDDRNDYLQAFREASKAAESVSERFRQAGNTASAKFYRDKAHALAEQMD